MKGKLGGSRRKVFINDNRSIITEALQVENQTKPLIRSCNSFQQFFNFFNIFY